MSNGSNHGRRLLVFGMLLLGAVIVQQLFMLPPVEPTHTPQPLPELLVQGWLNAEEPPTPTSLRGKWVILDLWSLECGTCRMEAPHLVRLHQKIANRDDVVLLGLNTFATDTPEAIREYLAGVPGYDWPVGHGADAMPSLLDAPYLPTLFLFGPDGQSVWRGHFVDQLAVQLESQLGIGK